MNFSNTVEPRPARRAALRSAALATALICFAHNAHAQSAQQFDLVCTGTASGTADGNSPWEGRYSIDLESGKFCGPPCKAPEAIARVEPDKLTLRDTGPLTTDPRDRKDKWRIVVNRSDGAYESEFIMMSVGIVAIIKGSCTVGKFTPFPKTLF